MPLLDSSFSLQEKVIMCFNLEQFKVTGNKTPTPGIRRIVQCLKGVKLVVTYQGHSPVSWVYFGLDQPKQGGQRWWWVRLVGDGG